MRISRGAALGFVIAMGLCGRPSATRARDLRVGTAQELRDAIAGALPGDVILLAPGAYRLSGARCDRPGTELAPIVVRASSALTARVDFDGVEGFHVTAEHWHFEGLDLRGVCSRDSDCEHAFHVTGAAHGFVLRNSRVLDFNAQLKVNAARVGASTLVPHGGLIEGNEIADTRARNTGNPTTKLNIDGGDDWVVRANYIHDFRKGEGDEISYGAFMKSGGRRGVFERNLVVCSTGVIVGGTRIGLSLGGGGTGAQFCAPAFDPSVPCEVEHSDGMLRNNLIVNCSDVGIYLNRARSSRVLHNTLIATSGVDFRFGTTTGEATGNVLAGRIRMRDGGTFRGSNNLENLSEASFAMMYQQPLDADLRRRGDLAMLLSRGAALSALTDDYCGRSRTGPTITLGALEHTLGDCDTARPTTTVPARPDAGHADLAPSEVGMSDAMSAPDALALVDATRGTDAPTEESVAPGDTNGCACGARSPRRRHGHILTMLMASCLACRQRRLLWKKTSARTIEHALAPWARPS